MATITKRKWTAEGVAKEAWQVRFQDQSGGWKRRQFTSKRDAFAFVREMEERAAAAVAPKTFAELCDDYLRVAQQRHDDGRLGFNRLRSLTCSFRDKVRPHLGNKLGEAITPDDIEAYHEALLRRGSLNRQSARVQLEYLLLVEAHANKRGLMMSRPVTAMMNDLRPTAREGIRTFTVDEVQRLLHHVGQRPPLAHFAAAARMNLFVNIATFCGLRRGEICALHVDNIKFGDSVIEVRHNLTQQRLVKNPKTKAGKRDVPMPPHIAEMVRDYLDHHHRPNPQGLIFSGRGHTPLNPNCVNEMWPGLLERAGLAHEKRPFHFHALRHFYASMMIEAGTPLADAAIMLGHSSYDETLQTYTHSVVRGPARHDFVTRMVDRFGGAASATPAGAVPKRLAVLLDHNSIQMGDR